MTRGRESNTAYVATDRPDGVHSDRHPSDDRRVTARSILVGVLHHAGAELSAHEMMAAEQEHWGSIAQLAAEYETIAAAAQRPRWITLVQASGLPASTVEVVIDSDAFGHLGAELRRAEAGGADPDALLPAVVRERGFDDAEDVAAVLTARLDRAVRRGGGHGQGRGMPRHIVGLVPEALGPMDAEMRRALDERRALMRARVVDLVDRAIEGNEAWVRGIGMPSFEARARWHRHAEIVAAYRDRYGVTGRDPIGPEPENDIQMMDAAVARVALAAARRAAWSAPTLDLARSASVDRGALVR
jgi:hypothetical protein